MQPIVVFDGDGRMVAALLRPACRPKGAEIVKWLLPRRSPDQVILAYVLARLPRLVT